MSLLVQVKGKAAIDVLGARLGKSGGALAQQGLVVACGSILTGAPVLATLFALVSDQPANQSYYLASEGREGGRERRGQTGRHRVGRYDTSTRVSVFFLIPVPAPVATRAGWN